MVQMNNALTSILQQSDMIWWCMPIENCDYMRISPDFQ